ncbi:hypothetical protein DVA76_18095, partial [Acinetobacter baumannii]
DLEKAYDRVSRELIWWVLEKKSILRIYIDIIMDMYDGTIIRVRATSEETREFFNYIRFILRINFESIFIGCDYG